jgi:hypothetical protein
MIRYEWCIIAFEIKKSRNGSDKKRLKQILTELMKLPSFIYSTF